MLKLFKNLKINKYVIFVRVNMRAYELHEKGSGVNKINMYYLFVLTCVRMKCMGRGAGRSTRATDVAASAIASSPLTAGLSYYCISSGSGAQYCRGARSYYTSTTGGK